MRLAAVSSWLLVTAGCLLACHGRYYHPPRDRSESLADSVRVGNQTYTILTCAGVNETLVPCGNDETELRFEGALVCQGGRTSSNSKGQHIQLPPSVCERLPKGCRPYQPPASKAEPWLAFDEVLLSVLRQSSIRVERESGYRYWLSFDDSPTNDARRRSSQWRPALSRALMKDHILVGWGLNSIQCPDGGDCADLQLPEMNRLLNRPERAARWLAKTLQISQADAVRFGSSMKIRLDLLPALDPRCASEDPLCGPVPYSRGCLGETNYRANVPRRVVGQDASFCENDGDCSADARCDGCNSRFTYLSTLQCREFLGSTWEDAFCGCVKGHCSWFTQ